MKVFVERSEAWPGTGEVGEWWPETPARIDAIVAGLQRAGLLQLPLSDDGVSDDETLRAVLAVHDAAFVDFLRSAYEDAARLRDGERCAVVPQYFAAAPMGRPPKNALYAAGFFASSPEDALGEHSFRCALASARCAVAAADAVASGTVSAAYSLARPPGHHAGVASYGGFCFFNNAAIAARRALGRIGVSGARASVLDCDYHHGNGTQAVFWRDPAVQYVSVHADPDAEYPYFWGRADETGGEEAPGTITNIPLPLGTSEEEWLAAFNSAIERVRAFAPNILVVSLGFDTAEGDPNTEGCAHNGVKEFRALGEMIRSLQLPTIFIQEGGYSKGDRLGDLAASFFRGFLHRVEVVADVDGDDE